MSSWFPIALLFPTRMSYLGDFESNIFKFMMEKIEQEYVRKFLFWVPEVIDLRSALIVISHSLEKVLELSIQLRTFF